MCGKRRGRALKQEKVAAEAIIAEAERKAERKRAADATYAAMRAAAAAREDARRCAAQAEVTNINSRIKARQKQQQVIEVQAQEHAKQLALDETERINAKIRGAQPGLQAPPREPRETSHPTRSD